MTPGEWHVRMRTALNEILTVDNLIDAQKIATDALDPNDILRRMAPVDAVGWAEAAFDEFRPVKVWSGDRWLDVHDILSGYDVRPI